jgi:hypothetical protein
MALIQDCCQFRRHNLKLITTMRQSKERYSTLNCSVKRAEEIFDAAMRLNVQFVVVWIDGHDLDSVRKYYLKFRSQEDLDVFKKIQSL